MSDHTGSIIMLAAVLFLIWLSDNGSLPLIVDAIKGKPTVNTPKSGTK